MNSNSFVIRIRESVMNKMKSEKLIFRESIDKAITTWDSGKSIIREIRNINDFFNNKPSQKCTLKCDENHRHINIEFYFLWIESPFHPVNTEFGMGVHSDAEEIISQKRDIIYTKYSGIATKMDKNKILISNISATNTFVSGQHFNFSKKLAFYVNQYLSKRVHEIKLQDIK